MWWKETARNAGGWWARMWGKNHITGSAIGTGFETFMVKWSEKLRWVLHELSESPLSPAKHAQLLIVLQHAAQFALCCYSRMPVIGSFTKSRELWLTVLDAEGSSVKASTHQVRLLAGLARGRKLKGKRSVPENDETSFGQEPTLTITNLLRCSWH